MQITLELNNPQDENLLLLLLQRLGIHYSIEQESVEQSQSCRSHTTNNCYKNPAKPIVPED